MKEKTRRRERHTAAGWAKLEDVLPLRKQARFCCHGNGAYWVTALPWHVSPQWCRPGHTHQHLTSYEEQGGFITDCQCWEQRGCMWWFFFFFLGPRCFVCVGGGSANFILHGTVSFSLLSAPLTYDPSPFQGDVSSPGAGTNMVCAETVHRPTSFSHSRFLVSDLFSLAVELDTLWQCALWRQTRDKILHRLHFSSIGAETFIQREAIRREKQWVHELTYCWLI